MSETTAISTTLPQLFARTTTGAVQVWSIEVDGNRFRTTAGQQDGKKVVSQWTITNVKNAGRANATTAEEQALFEARSRWQKKVDAGYKQDVADIDSISFLEPMLAHNYEDYKDDLTFPVFCQPKLDGVRCIARKEGLFSRNGKAFYPWPSIMNALAPVWAKDPTVIFDGEFYNHDFKDDFNEIVSMVKKTKPKPEDIEKVAKFLQYHVYDIPSKKETAFGDRSRSLYIMLGFPDTGAIRIVATHKMINQQELDEAYAEFAEAGYEGQMVRIDAPYENKRSKHLLKRKEFDEGEYTILAVTQGEGNKTGWAASMSFQMPNGKPFNSNVKGNEAHLRQLWADREKLIGKLATVRHFKLTPDGLPRFPYVIALRDYE